MTPRHLDRTGSCPPRQPRGRDHGDRARCVHDSESRVGVAGGGEPRVLLLWPPLQFSGELGDGRKVVAVTVGGPCGAPEMGPLDR